MKKLLFIIFLLSKIICYAEYDSTYVLSVTQKYAIPEDVSNGDDVGTWRKTWTWITVGAISYSIEQNFNNTFSINSTSGLISVIDASKINGKILRQDTLINLIIRTTDSGVGHELDTARIWVKENSFCKFIDYKYIGTENGTRSQPYNDLDDVAIIPGYGYFIKRGTRFIQGQTRLKAHFATALNPTIIGAYGTGNLPTFDGVGQSHCFQMGDNANPETDKVENIKFYDLAIKRYPNCAWKLLRKSSYCGWYNCVSDSNAFKYSEAQLIINTSNYIDSTNYLPNEIINCTFNRTVEDPTHPDEFSSLVKCGNGPLTTINCYFSNSINNGWRNTCGNYGSLKHCVFENISRKSVQIRGDHTTIEDVRMLNSGQYGIEITGNEIPDGADYTRIKNCYISGSGINAIRIAEISSEYQVMKSHIIEDCTIKNGDIGIMSNDSRNLTIRRNKIYGFTSYPIRIYTNYTNKVFDPEISYNVIYNTKAVVIEDGTGAIVYNNTVDGEIDLRGSGSAIVRNNYFRNLLNDGISSNNLDMDTISTTKHFFDYLNHDYRLKTTAFSSIDHGYNVSLISDIIGSSVPKGSKPDIGAYEGETGSNENPLPDPDPDPNPDPVPMIRKIYPNPTKGIVHIQVDGNVQNSKQVLKIYDLKGQPVFLKPVYPIMEGQEVEVDLSHLPKGLYFIHLGNLIKEKILLQ